MVGFEGAQRVCFVFERGGEGHSCTVLMIEKVWQTTVFGLWNLHETEGIRSLVICTKTINNDKTNKQTKSS